MSRLPIPQAARRPAAPRAHKRPLEEQRPVLQLPVESPGWREPPDRERGEPRDEPDPDRGVTQIDFYL